MTGEPRIDALVMALRARGASVQPGEAASETPRFPFSMPEQLFQINGDEVQIYLYATATAAATDAAHISSDGFTFVPIDDAPTDYVAAKHREIAGLILQAPLNLRLEEALVYQYLNIGLPYLEEVIDQDSDGKLSRVEVAAIPAGPAWFLGLFSLPTPFLAALLPYMP